jgi:glycosyltransferase involved in cell wall biosynthesis
VRILVISNFYPPYYIGGYELGCFEAVQSLIQRDHTVKVLTSTYGLTEPHQVEGAVYRQLWTYIGRDFSKAELFNKERHNQRVTRRMIKEFKPDVVYIWNLWQVSLSIASVAQQLGRPVCYYIFDSWLAQWGQADDWFTWWAYLPVNPLKRPVKKLLRRLLPLLGLQTGTVPPNLRYVQFASHFLKQQAIQAGQPVDAAPVIHWGLDLAAFPERPITGQPPTRLLYVGQLMAHKGVHTLIEAFHRLITTYGLVDIDLTLVGGTIVPAYETRLKELVHSLGLSHQIHFAGPLPRVQIPAIYQQHDIMIVPSVWDEPFGLILLEAMASGLAVVGTATGGSAEILRHEINGLVFAREDSPACAACLYRLLTDPLLYERLRRQGRQTVEQHFRLEQTIDQIEQSLQETSLAAL